MMGSRLEGFSGSARLERVNKPEKKKEERRGGIDINFIKNTSPEALRAMFMEFRASQNASK